jgi:hypothetical protein
MSPAIAQRRRRRTALQSHFGYCFDAANVSDRARAMNGRPDRRHRGRRMMLAWVERVRAPRRLTPLGD